MVWIISKNKLALTFSVDGMSSTDCELMRFHEGGAWRRDARSVCQCKK
jgi:hypothetical protein